MSDQNKVKDLQRQAAVLENKLEDNSKKLAHLQILHELLINSSSNEDLIKIANECIDYLCPHDKEECLELLKDLDNSL